MNRIIASLFFLLTIITGLFSQEIEKIGIIEEMKFISGIAGGPDSPNEIYVDEINNFVKILNIDTEYQYYELSTLKGGKKGNYRSSFAIVQKQFKDYEISFASSVLRVANRGKQISYIAKDGEIQSGISFILKKDSGYIVYFVSEGGTPKAVDTTGKIYSNTEALAYLKEYDPEKYAESLTRAEELGLKSEFERGNVLIWGQTYYSTNNGLEKVFGEPIYGHPELVQYDNQGYGYQVYLSNFYSYVQIVSNTQETICMDYDINNYTDIFLSNNDNIPFSASWYVGYGGNIYYYIAGEEYTEVFRIRRTWGNPDMYAMAINGYTEDNYGKYVTETLSTMSKSDLRLLRNTIFALYGVHFKSEDLSKHFAKEVWYTDEDKTSGEVELPAHRQKLVEMIQELERK